VASVLWQIAEFAKVEFEREVWVGECLQVFRSAGGAGLEFKLRHDEDIKKCVAEDAEFAGIENAFREELVQFEGMLGKEAKPKHHVLLKLIRECIGRQGALVFVLVEHSCDIEPLQYYLKTALKDISESITCVLNQTSIDPTEFSQKKIVLLKQSVEFQGIVSSNCVKIFFDRLNTSLPEMDASKYLCYYFENTVKEEELYREALLKVPKFEIVQNERLEHNETSFKAATDTHVQKIENLEIFDDANQTYVSPSPISTPLRVSREDAKTKRKIDSTVEPQKRKKPNSSVYVPEDLGFIQPSLLVPKLNFSNSFVKFWDYRIQVFPGNFSKKQFFIAKLVGHDKGIRGIYVPTRKGWVLLTIDDVNAYWSKFNVSKFSVSNRKKVTEYVKHERKFMYYAVAFLYSNALVDTNLNSYTVSKDVQNLLVTQAPYAIIPDSQKSSSSTSSNTAPSENHQIPQSIKPPTSTVSQEYVNPSTSWGFQHSEQPSNPPASQKLPIPQVSQETVNQSTLSVSRNLTQPPTPPASQKPPTSHIPQETVKPFSSWISNHSSQSSTPPASQKPQVSHISMQTGKPPYPPVSHQSAQPPTPPVSQQNAKPPTPRVFQKLSSKNLEEELDNLLRTSNDLENVLRRCLMFRFPGQLIDRLLNFERAQQSNGRFVSNCTVNLPSSAPIHRSSDFRSTSKIADEDASYQMIYSLLDREDFSALDFLK
jgi:hypothetical protein